MRTSIKRFLGAVYPLALLGALMFVWSVQVRAEAAANVHFVSGYVAASAPGAADRQLAKGDDVLRRDRIETADNGRVQMRFTDGGLVSLMPNSTFTVEEYFHDGGPDDDASLVFGLLKGGLRTVTGTIGRVQHDQYELKTPVATLGIRGTEYVAVLRPANTLRVHVGRGKVVISNDLGSLEVPEGHNAVVTQGSAPELSDQGPQYQATGPRGDRLVALYQQHQDPHLLDPRANMPPLTIDDFLGVGQSGGSGGSGGTGGSGGPDDSGGTGGSGSDTLPQGTYQMLAYFPPFSGGPSPLDQSISLEFDSDGHLTSLQPGAFDTGEWQAFNVVTQGALTWGEFGGGVGLVAGDYVTLNVDMYAPYVVGSLTDVTTLPVAGTLNYSLDGATPARAINSDGTFLGAGTLDQFSMAIDVANLAITYGLQLNMPENANMGFTGGTYSASGASGITGSGNLPRFSFSGQVIHDTCTACTIDVNGFLAGDSASQAGILYNVNDPLHDAVISGAAGLKRD